MNLGLGLSINSRNNVQAPISLLLDNYPARVAYSLRKLRTDYLGSAIRVRRSSDNAKQDIGFDENGNLNATALLTFVGVNNGFVNIWYDQSGNGFDTIESSAFEEPTIVSSGVLLEVNGKPGVSFDGSNDNLFTNVIGLNTVTNLSSFSVVQPIAAASSDSSTLWIWSYGTNTTGGLILTGSPPLSGISGEKFGLFYDTASNPASFLGSSTYTRSANSQIQISSFHLSNGTSFYENSELIDLDLASGMTTATAAAPFNTNNTDTTLTLNGVGSGLINGPANIGQEYIFYISNETSNRASIEADQNAYYLIY